MMLIRSVHTLWLNRTLVGSAESGLVNTEAAPLYFSRTFDADVFRGRGIGAFGIKGEGGKF